MNKLKEKIFGFLIVLSIVIIILQLLSHRTLHQKVHLTTNIPARPDKISPVVVKKSESESENENENESEEQVPVPVVATLQEKETKEKGWIIQLGVFANLKNAEDLVIKLTSQGYPAYFDTVQREKGKVNMVFVGPKVNKKDIIKWKETLKSKYQLEGIVVRYEPNS